MRKSAEQYLQEQKKRKNNSSSSGNGFWAKLTKTQKTILAILGIIIILVAGFFTVNHFLNDSPPDPNPSLVGEGAQEKLPEHQPGLGGEGAPMTLDLEEKSGIKVDPVDLTPASNPTVAPEDNPCAPENGEKVQQPNDCALIPPEDDIQNTAAWYQRSAKPGSKDQGSVVMTSHINYANVNGVGTYFTHLKKGDVVTVHTDAGEHKYKVTEPMQLVPKADPAAFKEMGDRTFNKTTGAEQLILITCAGQFVPGSPLGYQDNGIVVLDPIS